MCYKTRKSVKIILIAVLLPINSNTDIINLLLALLMILHFNKKFLLLTRIRMCLWFSFWVIKRNFSHCNKIFNFNHRKYPKSEVQLCQIIIHNEPKMTQLSIQFYDSRIFNCSRLLPVMAKTLISFKRVKLRIFLNSHSNSPTYLLTDEPLPLLLSIFSNSHICAIKKWKWKKYIHAHDTFKLTGNFLLLARKKYQPSTFKSDDVWR